MTTWRDAARPIIARVLAETQGQEEKVIRKALKEAYPVQWLPRSNTPYKEWCAEIRCQRGTPSKGTRKQRELYAKAMAGEELPKIGKWDALLRNIE